MEQLNESNKTILLTGASGYIAGHILVQLLQQGYMVRGTVRSLAKEAAVREMVASTVAAGANLELVEADLNSDDGWAEAVSGCAYVLHTASPLPLTPPDHEDDLIVPARDGTLRVMRAAAAASVRRVVLTSSVSAISGGHARAGKVFDESYWADTEGDITAYQKSKYFAERAAWDFLEELPEDQPLELAVINPGLVLGPLLDGRAASSVQIVRLVLARAYPGWPRIGWSIVDVRDVAAAHLAAMTRPEAAGKRFCCTNEWRWHQEIAMILADHFAAQGYRISTRQMPDFFLRLFALFDARAKTTVGNLGKKTEYSHELLSTTLDWMPRPVEETIVATGESIIQFGLA